MPVRVNSATAAALTSSTPVLKQGSSGSAVADLQRKLAAAGFSAGGVDGLFGPATRAAVLAFQRSHGLTADGVVGPQTWGALNRAGSAASQPVATGGQPTLRAGSNGAAVADMQRKLAAAGFNPGPIDGAFGPATDRALRSFQRSRGLTADGICGPQTWGALNRTGASTGTAPSSPSGGHPTLRRGSTGGAVVELQRKLAASGFNPGPVDGDFGAATDRALRAFQRNRGLEADGVCGPRTWAALEGTSFDPDPRRDTRGLRERILSIAQGEVGTIESSNRNDGGVLKYPRYFGRGSEAYCADFVSWVFTKAGKPLDYAYCPYLKNHLVSEGKWKGRSNPQPGDIVLFDWDHDSVADHVGIVRGVNPDGTILTIEGNTENPSTGREGVWNRTRSMSTIMGFGSP